MIAAKAVIVSEPFTAAIPVLEGRHPGVDHRACSQKPTDPVETGEDDVALIQLASGSTGHQAVRSLYRNLYRTLRRCSSVPSSTWTPMIVSWPLFHDMGMTGFLVVPMYFGAELVRITPIDFLRDTLLWAKLIDQYKGTMTAAPNFAYAVCQAAARKAQPGQDRSFDTALGAIGCRKPNPPTSGTDRRGRAVRRVRGDPAGLRHGRDHDCGVVLRMRRRTCCR
jgi:fatty-acyl-CoA synthase